MDDIALAIRLAWNRVAPTLEGAELRRRLARGRNALSRPPRAWCIAIRASDSRLDRCCCSYPDPSREHQLLLDLQTLRKVCAPVKLDPGGETLKSLCKMLGVKPASLLNSRVGGLFRTQYIAGLSGRWGKPRPLLSASQPLDPAARGFALPDPIWSWTATYLTSRLPSDFPAQLLVRLPHFRRRGPKYADRDQLHPEHPDLDPVPTKRRSLALPPPQPDYVWYKWKDGEYVGHDWRNPAAAAGFARAQQRLALAREAGKQRRRLNPKPGKPVGSKLFNGWRWECPRCRRAVHVLYLPAPPVNLAGDLLRENPKSESRNPKQCQNPKAVNSKPVAPEGSCFQNSDFGHSDFLRISDFDIRVSPQASFACGACHGVRHLSLTRLSAGWGEVIRYLSAGLLYGCEVERPDWLVPQRKLAYHPKPNRPPSLRRPQIEKLLLAGHPISQVAARLSLAKGTILFYCQQIYREHGVRSLKELLLKHGLNPRPHMRGAGQGKYGLGRVSRKQQRLQPAPHQGLKEIASR